MCEYILGGDVVVFRIFLFEHSCNVMNSGVVRRESPVRLRRERRITVSSRESEGEGGRERRVILGPHVMMKWKNKNTYRWGTGSLRIHSLSIPPHPLTLVLM